MVAIVHEEYSEFSISTGANCEVHFTLVGIYPTKDDAETWLISNGFRKDTVGQWYKDEDTEELWRVVAEGEELGAVFYKDRYM